MDINEMTAVFGWMLVINVAIYALSAVFIIFARDFAVKLQAQIPGVPAEDWPQILMDYLSRYKIAILVFNFVPWLALRIVA